jgi:DNA-binding MarR family transcriptional regulator
MPRRRNSFLQLLEHFRELHPGLVVADLVAFLYICENEGLNITELAQLGRFTGATASRRARALAGPDTPSPRPPSLGLVEIYEGGDDARARQIFLTDKGRAAREAISEMITRAIPLAEPAWRASDPRSHNPFAAAS